MKTKIFDKNGTDITEIIRAEIAKARASKSDVAVTINGISFYVSPKTKLLEAIETFFEIDERVAEIERNKKQNLRKTR